MASLNQSFEKHLQRFLDELVPRSRSIIKRRYGIGFASCMTLEAIGQRERITRERVRQIENDAIKRLKKSPMFATLATYEETAQDALDKHGGLVAEQVAVALPEFRAVGDKNLLLFFFDICDGFVHRKADDLFHARWHTKRAPAEKIESALAAFIGELRASQKTLAEQEARARLAEHLERASAVAANGAFADEYLELSHAIAKNSWGEIGHVSSPFVRPKGMREGAFVVLSRAGEPLHFREIASRIGDFLGKSVHMQTVHNELIKDARFVLVGRGLYALGKWGYEPGFVRDVLVRMLRERGQMTRDEILAEISRVRQVKPSTVAINLQNKKLFKTLDNGVYTLVS